MAKKKSKAPAPVKKATPKRHKKKVVASKKLQTAAKSERLYPPKNGVTVRFYRIGHGDCFLLALPGDSDDQPVYVLIDCGYKPGSPGKLAVATSAEKIWADIRGATGGHIHVAVITHEHQDHVNGITKKNLGDITIGETWLAWTEDPEDDVAKRLRTVYNDKLRGLVAARNRLNAAGDEKKVQFIDSFLEFELGGDAEEFSFEGATLGLDETLGLNAGAAAPLPKGNKGSMALFKRLALDGVKFIRPHQQVLRVPGAKSIRVFPLGPPRKETELQDMDPQGGEEFPGHSLAAASPGNFFASAALASEVAPPQPLFAPRYTLAFRSAADDLEYGEFFRTYYGPPLPVSTLSPPAGATPPIQPVDAVALSATIPDEAPDDADWRRIDGDWLGSAEQLALDLNDYTNNTSLVLAFELGRGGKVLLFAADAQRGNWRSWTAQDFTDGKRKITVRDLLGRTVLYKTGHHGSHNATLNGVERDEYANLGWMGLGEYAAEFTAMITAVPAWAATQKGWNHPYPPIKDALEKKASGRVLQTDVGYEDMQKPANASESQWNRFRKRVRGTALYFDVDVTL